MRPIKIIFILALNILPVLFDYGLQAQGLQLTTGIHWVVNGAPNLILNNTGLTNNGDFVADSGTVSFTGGADNAVSVIGGDHPIAFYNLVIGRTLRDVQLNNNAGVSGSITMDSGNLQLNNYTLDLGSSGTIIGERNNSCITGFSGGCIKVTALLNAPQSVNPGNIGVEITTPVDMGSTTITRSHFQQTNSAGQSAIQRFFDIVPVVNTGLHATLRFYYLDGELAGSNKETLAIFSGEHGNWSLQGRDKFNTDANWVVKSNIDELHRFTLALAPANEMTKSFIHIYPNPSHDAFTIVLFSDKDEKGIINLFDQSGHLLESKQVHFTPGPNTIGWNIANYAKGIYYLGLGKPGVNNVAIIKQ